MTFFRCANPRDAVPWERQTCPPFIYTYIYRSYTHAHARYTYITHTHTRARIYLAFTRHALFASEIYYSPAVRYVTGNSFVGFENAATRPSATSELNTRDVILFTYNSTPDRFAFRSPLTELRRRYERLFRISSFPFVPSIRPITCAGESEFSVRRTRAFKGRRDGRNAKLGSVSKRPRNTSRRIVAGPIDRWSRVKRPVVYKWPERAKRIPNGTKGQTANEEIVFRRVTFVTTDDACFLPIRPCWTRGRPVANGPRVPVPKRAIVAIRFYRRVGDIFAFPLRPCFRYYSSRPTKKKKTHWGAYEENLQFVIVVENIEPVCGRRIDRFIPNEQSDETPEQRARVHGVFGQTQPVEHENS